MKKTINILLISLLSLSLPAQTDSLIHRSVTVEREFQPVIESAGKINVTPRTYEPEIETLPIRYSQYTTPLNTDFNVNRLGYSSVKFGQPRPMHGFLQGGIGHTNTLFNFNYQLTEKKDIIFDINANHLGQWGRKTLSRSELGINFSKLLTNTNFYFGVDGRNRYFTRYGKYFSYTDPGKGKGVFEGLRRYSDFQPQDKATHWEVDTKIGFRSLPNQDVRYYAQTGYEAFVIGNVATEHQINTQAMLNWKLGDHHVGGKLLVQNRLYSLEKPDWTVAKAHGNDTVVRDNHVIKIEPFYEYQGKRFRIHAGVNIDFAVRTGSKVCLPSPNVDFEAQLTKDWLAFYGGAVGDYIVSSVKENYQFNYYLYPELELTNATQRTYMPVDAFLGFKIRPQANLLIDIYAHYINLMYDIFYKAESASEPSGYFTLVGSNSQCWKVGGQANYHYQDIVNISLDGHYNKWIVKDYTYAYYRPSWEVTLRIDAKINSKISLYSDNYFAGGRYALVGDEDVRLKPTIDLNIGAQYNINKWLSCYLQLNNYLHRKHDIFYGYQAAGINFIAGVSWTF